MSKGNEKRLYLDGNGKNIGQAVLTEHLSNRQKRSYHFHIVVFSTLLHCLIYSFLKWYRFESMQKRETINSIELDYNSCHKHWDATLRQTFV